MIHVRGKYLRFMKNNNLSVVVGEANLFEEALQKYGKDFTDIQKDFVSSHLLGHMPRKILCNRTYNQ